MIKSKKKAVQPKKPYAVLRTIITVLICLLLLLGVGARIYHFFTVHRP